MKENKNLDESCETCESCDEMFEHNIDDIISDATPPTMEQHNEKEAEVRDVYIEKM